MNDQLLTQLTQALLQYEPPNDYRGSQIHASEVKECIRKTFYRITKAEPDPDRIQNFNRAKFTMAYGSLLEIYVTKWLDQLEIPWHKQSVENKDLNIVGETDPVIEYQDNTIILEVKGVHQRQYETLYSQALINQPIETYYHQLQTYLWLYDKADFGAFLIGNRNCNPQDKLSPFFLQEIQRDENWRHITLEEPDGRIPKLNLYLDTNELPPREFHDRTKFPCSYCIYNTRCWEKDV